MAVLFLVVIGVAAVVIMTVTLAACAIQRHSKRSKKPELKRAGYDVINRTSEVNIYSSPVKDVIRPESHVTNTTSSGYNYVPTMDRTRDYYDLPLFIKDDHPKSDRSQTLRNQTDKQTVMVRRFGSETQISIEDRRHDNDLCDTGVTKTNVKLPQDKSRTGISPQRSGNKETVHVETFGSESRIHFGKSQLTDLTVRSDVKNHSETSRADRELDLLGTNRVMNNKSPNRGADKSKILWVAEPEKMRDEKRNNGVSYENVSITDGQNETTSVKSKDMMMNTISSQENKLDLMNYGASVNTDDLIAENYSPSRDLSLSVQPVEDQSLHYLKLSECETGQHSVNVKATYINVSVPCMSSTHSDVKSSLVDCDVNIIDSSKLNSKHLVTDDHVCDKTTQPSTDVSINDTHVLPMRAEGISINIPDNEKVTNDAHSDDEDCYVIV